MKTTKTIVLATFGTLGDIYPFVAIALALQARGLKAVIAAPEMHRSAIEGEGVAFPETAKDFARLIASETGAEAIADWAEEMS